MDKSDQAQNTPSTKEDFDAMTPEQLEAHMDTQESLAEDKQSEAIAPESTDSSAETTEQPADSSKTESTKPDASKDNQEFDYKTAYRELQAEFTRRNQASKKLEQEFNALRSQVQSKPTQDADEADPLEQLKEKSPEAAKLFEAIEKRISKNLKKEIEPIEQRVVLRERQKNQENFVNQLREFQTSELKELEPELMSILADVGDDSAVVEYAQTDPELFTKLKKELFFKYFDKVTEIKQRVKQSSNAQGAKSKALSDAAGVGTKSKVSKLVPTTPDQAELYKKSPKDLEELLRKSGNWED